MRNLANAYEPIVIAGTVLNQQTLAMDPYLGRRYGGGIMCGVMCPPDTFLYSYYCCNYGECCIHLGGWAIFLIILAVILLLLCCAGCVGGFFYAARKNTSKNSEP